MSSRCWFTKQHLSAFIHHHYIRSIRFTFSHSAVVQRSSKRPLPVRRTAVRRLSQKVKQTLLRLNIYNLFIYKQINGQSGWTVGEKEQRWWRELWVTCPNHYKLIMQVLGWTRDQQNKLSSTVLEIYHTKSLHRKRRLCKKGHRATRLSFTCYWHRFGQQTSKGTGRSEGGAASHHA